MPSIKYYQFTKENGCPNGTCYDGALEFSFPKKKKNDSPSRFYPDEFLIAHILNKYLLRRLKDKANDQFIVIVEPWRDINNPSILVRPGGENEAINPIIIEAAKNQSNENKLILVPFLYGYHHPGIAINLAGKRALYIDPFGTKPIYGKKQTERLIDELKTAGITVDHVTAQQQEKITEEQIDRTSCGPILTASMIKLIEDYLAIGEISSQGFEAPRSVLATDRMFQMYVNNTTELDDGLGIDEIMLAGTNLWEAFLLEQNGVIDDTIAKQIYQIVDEQKRYIDGLNLYQTELTEGDKRKIDFIKQFQSRLTELIFLRKEHKKFSALIEKHNELFALDDKELILKTYAPIKLTDLFSDKNFPRTLEVLKINLVAPKKNEPLVVEKRKTASHTPSWKFIGFKLAFALIKNQNLALLLLFLLIASTIGFVVLTVLALSLSPWLAIPCALLFLAMLVAIKIAYNEYQSGKRIEEPKKIFEDDNNREDLNLQNDLKEPIKQTSTRVIINQNNSPLIFLTNEAPIKNIEMQKAEWVKQLIIEKVNQLITGKDFITVKYLDTDLEFSAQEIQSCFSNLEKKLIIVNKGANDYALEWGDITVPTQVKSKFFDAEKQLTTFNYPDRRQMLLVVNIINRCLDGEFAVSFTSLLKSEINKKEDQLPCSVYISSQKIDEIVKKYHTTHYLRMNQF